MIQPPKWTIGQWFPGDVGLSTLVGGGACAHPGGVSITRATEVLPASPDEPTIPSTPGDSPVRWRSLLRGIGVGAATVVVAGTGVLSYRTYDNGVLDSGSGAPYDPWSHWREDRSPLGAVGAAILAANPHNSQPWIFHVTDNAIEVFTDPTRGTGTLDPLGREHHVGMGCAVENLVLAAGARGYRATVALLPERGNPAHVATVGLTSATATSSPLYDAIGSRHSNRGPYKSAAVPAPVIAALAAQTGGLDGVQVRWFTTAKHKIALGGLLVDAARAITLDTRQSTDAFVWFRDTRDDIDRHRDGLTLDGQGLDQLTLTVAKLLPAESRTAGDAFWLAQTRTVHTKTAAAYGVITVADPDNSETRLTGGRLLQRIHLAATAAGLGLQHMNQITERIDRERTTGMPATFAPAFDALLGHPGRRPLATFRIGYPVRAARLSPRRALTAVTR